MTKRRFIEHLPVVTTMLLLGCAGVIQIGDEGRDGGPQGEARVQNDSDASAADGGSASDGAARETDAAVSTGPNPVATDAGGSKPMAADAASARDAGPDQPDIPIAPKDAGPSASAARLTAYPLGGGSNAPNGYYEYLPPGYDGSKAAPLIVFWHGIGANGNGTTDLSKVIEDGMPLVIKNNSWPDSRPFIVLAPQNTGIGGEIAPGKGCPSSAIVDAFVSWALARYNVDPKRIYLSGLSCGAIGSWDYLADHQGTTVAATVLVAGNPGDPTLASSTWMRAGGCALGANLAVWSLHGDSDETVPFAPDRDTMQDLIACPTPARRPAVFTPIVGGGHNIWNPIFDLTGGQGDIYQWMLNNAKP